MWGALTLATTAGVAFALGSWLGSSGDGAPDERQRRSELADVGAARLAATTRAEQMIEDGDVAGGGSLRFTDARCDLQFHFVMTRFVLAKDVANLSFSGCRRVSVDAKAVPGTCSQMDLRGKLFVGNA